MLATGTNCSAMAREVLVLFELVGANSNVEGNAFDGGAPFYAVFLAYVDWVGYNRAVTRFFYLNVLVE